MALEGTHPRGENNWRITMKSTYYRFLSKLNICTHNYVNNLSISGAVVMKYLSKTSNAKGMLLI